MSKFESKMNSAQKQRLTSAERSFLREKILHTMQQYPIKNSYPVFSPWMQYVFGHVRTASLVLVLFFMFTTSAIAEQTVPGNLFYGVKTGVNEKVLGWFANSPEKKEEWQLALADRRLVEIQQLSHEKKLSPELKEDLENQIALRTKHSFDDDSDNEISLVKESSEVSEVEFSTLKQASFQSVMTAKTVVNSEAFVGTATPTVSREESVDSSVLEKLRGELQDQRLNLEKTKVDLRKRGMYSKSKARLIKADNELFNAREAISNGENEKALLLYRKAQDLLECSHYLSSVSVENPTMSSVTRCVQNFRMNTEIQSNTIDKTSASSEVKGEYTDTSRDIETSKTIQTTTNQKDTKKEQNDSREEGTGASLTPSDTQKEVEKTIE